MLTAADRLDDKASGFELGADDYVSSLRKRLGEPWIVATVAGVGYRIDATAGTGA